MTPGAELEKQIIGALILKPELVEAAAGLSAQDFLDKANKLIFMGINDFWQDNQREIIDEFLLSKKTGILLADILKLQEGCYIPKNEIFSLWASELQKLRCIGKIIPLLDKEVRWLDNTGEYNLEAFEKIREHLYEFDCLTQSDVAKSPLSIQVADIEPEPVKWLWPTYQWRSRRRENLALS
jgi:hypothetical protein